MINKRNKLPLVGRFFIDQMTMKTFKKLFTVNETWVYDYAKTKAPPLQVFQTSGSC